MTLLHRSDRRPLLRVIAVGAALLGAAPAAEAQGVPISLTGGLTAVGQTTSDERVRSEVVSSVDLFLEVDLGRALFVTYVEGNTTPALGGVSRMIGEANTDAGTALDRRRRGRVQLSEVRMVLPLAEDLAGHVGLLDATGFLDVSRIANDENLFFLGVPFVNNPTIEFPDYSLGLAVDGRMLGTEHVRLGAVVTSSHGLADNPNVSYAQLLDVREEGKGLFAGAALRWRGSDRRLSLGAWVNSAEHPRLDGDGTEPARGVYSVVGWFRGDHSVSARAGLSNGDVSAIHGFAGLTYLWMRRPDALGLAVGRSFVSSAASEALEDVVHGEVFLRRRLVADIFITASLQRIHNSGFDPSGTTVAAAVWVAGARFSTQF